MNSCVCKSPGCLTCENVALKLTIEADQEIYHQVYMVLLNAGTDKYLGALEQAQALVARLAEAERHLREIADMDWSGNCPPAVMVAKHYWERSSDSASVLRTPDDPLSPNYDPTAVTVSV